MLYKKNGTLHSHPSLLPLRMALSAAESGVPSRPTRPLQTITDEQRATELIERMRTEYDKPLPFICWKDESNSTVFNLREVVGMYV